MKVDSSILEIGLFRVKGGVGGNIIGLSHVRRLIGIFINRLAAIILWDDTVTICTTYNYATSEEKLLNIETDQKRRQLNQRSRKFD